MRVFVTGIAGDIGFSICKILKKEKKIKFLLGGDLHNSHLGKLLCDKFVITKKVEQKNYFKNLLFLIEKYKIDCIIPTFESEQKRLAELVPTRKLLGADIILANKKSLDIGFDKFKTYEFLKKNNLPYPWTIPLEKGLPKQLPCILKSRFSSGNSDVKIIKKSRNLNLYRKIFHGHVWQENIGNAHNEYTCGVFRSSQKDVRVIIFKRRLSLGISMYAEIVENKKIKSLCIDVAKKLDLSGSINIQLRMRNNTPVIFEINPRFSSTVIFRKLLGFNDVMWSIFDKKNITLKKNYKIKKNKELYKFFNEKVL